MSGLDVSSICGGGQVKVPRNSAIPEIAQLYATGLYRTYFRSLYPAGEVFSEWDIVGNTGVGTGRSVLDMVLLQVKNNFRNYYSKSQRNRALIKAGTPASGLREGRSIRADALGLALDPQQRAIVTELVEVTTVDEADDTIIEDIQPKLALLRGPIKTLVEAVLDEARRSATLVPDHFSANGSPFIVPAPLAVVPIFTDTSAAMNSSPDAQYRWICFAPTYKYRPFPFGGMLAGAVEPESAPARGLIVYSYHQANTRAGVPKAVVERFKDWLKKQQRRYQRLELLPLPEVSRYWQDNNDDLKIMLAYVALATVAVAVVVLAIYLLPLVAGAAGASLTALSTATSIEAVGAQAGALIGLISANVPQIMNLSRTTVQSVANFDPMQAIVF